MGIVFNQCCLCHGLSPSPCISCTHSGLFWTSVTLYFKMMFVCSDHFKQMLTFHCWGNFILRIWFNSTLQHWKMMHFLPCVTFVESWSNWSSGEQIPGDICTGFGCYLYSAEWSSIIIHVTLFSCMKNETYLSHQFFF